MSQKFSEQELNDPSLLQTLSSKPELINDYIDSLLLDVEDYVGDEVEHEIEHDLTNTQTAKAQAQENLYAHPFQAIVLQIGSMKLAIALHSIRAVSRHQWLHRHFKLDSWQLGTIRHRDTNLKVVDLANWLNCANRADLDENDSFFTLVLNDRWALYMDRLPHTAKVDPNQVIWRSNADERGWILGTVKDQGCSLLDGQVLGQAFDEFGKRANT